MKMRTPERDLKNLTILFILLFCSFFPAYTIELPVPENDMLYTEFICTTSSPYLKEKIVSSGIIVMNGKNKFLYRQDKPKKIILKKINEDVTFETETGIVTRLNSSIIYNEIMLLFDSPEHAGEVFFISLIEHKDQNEYKIIPKTDSPVENILLFARGDKISSIEISFKNRTRSVYTFYNTQTGKIAGDSYF